eukprot:TRINITY_DN3105_c0_g1_i1.p1 TRINITY_DN3105_c0_g1~~TRINITY_DN3105_c0_g1_i1.p1  ORF type:complete len:209 (-),score=78.57 TRINITY_DN3105_c0_g1_i1:64-690(-)
MAAVAPDADVLYATISSRLAELQRFLTERSHGDSAEEVRHREMLAVLSNVSDDVGLLWQKRKSSSSGMEDEPDQDEQPGDMESEMTPEEEEEVAAPVVWRKPMADAAQRVLFLTRGQLIVMWLFRGQEEAPLSRDEIRAAAVPPYAEAALLEACAGELEAAGVLARWGTGGEDSCDSWELTPACRVWEEGAQQEDGGARVCFFDVSFD